MKIGIIGHGRRQSYLMLDYLRNNPHEAEKLDQILNCRNPNNCNDDKNEDKNGMCSKLIATNIIWDVDDNDNIKLPEIMEIPEDMEDEDEISDYLSNETGYCHKGFTLSTSIYTWQI